VPPRSGQVPDGKWHSRVGGYVLPGLYHLILLRARLTLTKSAANAQEQVITLGKGALARLRLGARHTVERVAGQDPYLPRPREGAEDRAGGVVLGGVGPRLFGTGLGSC
jgi:hypothetical protein